MEAEPIHLITAAPAMASIFLADVIWDRWADLLVEDNCKHIDLGLSVVVLAMAIIAKHIERIITCLAIKL